MTATSIAPAPGSTVSRRVEMRVVFDRDVDPASIDGSTCRMTLIGPLAATVALPVSAPTVVLETAYTAGARLLTLQPRQPLMRGGIYRVELTTGLRLLTGESFARPITWELTADPTLVFGSAFDLDAGTLLAAVPSRRSGALVVLAYPDGSLQYRRFGGIEWSPARPVGITAAFAADVAEDETGRVVVVAITAGGRVVLAESNGGAFATPQDLGAAGSPHLDVDASGSGHVLLATFDGLATGGVRSRVPGIGWTAPLTILGGLPHVQLQAAGDGIAVAAIRSSSGPGSGSTKGWRFCVDALGNWSQCDPSLPPSTVAVPGTSRAEFRDDRVLLASTASPLGIELFERRSGAWLDLDIPLGFDMQAVGLALGPDDLAAATTIQAGLRPVLRRRLEVGFATSLLGRAEEPAPDQPTTGVGITGDLATHVLWTAKVDATAGAAVRLMATSLPAAGAPGDEVVVDGPFAPETMPIQNLRVVTFGAANAVAVWSRAGTVRYTLLR